MKNRFKKFSFIAVIVIVLCGSVVAAYATRCILKCPICGSIETNHFHPNEGKGAQVLCRSCGYEWFDADPKQEPKKENINENTN